MPPPATRVPYHWWVVVLMTLAMVGDGLVVQGIPVLYPFIREELGLSRAEVGLITSAIVSTSVFTVVLGGWLSDSWGVRRILSLSLVYTAVPMFLFAFTNSLWMALLIGLLIGVGVGPVYPVTSKAIMDWLPVRLRAFTMSLKQTGPTVAGALAALSLPILAVTIGWGIAAMTVAFVQVLIAIAVLRFYKDPPLQRARPQRPLALADLTIIARDRSLVVLTVWGFFFVGAQFVVLSFLILFLVEQVGYSEIAAGGFLSAALIASTGARILWGLASDFLLKARRKLTLVLLSGSGAAAFFLASTVGAGTPVVIVGAAAIGMGVTAMSWPGIFTAYVAEVAGADRAGMAIGAVNAVMRIGVVVLPPLFGLLVDVLGTYNLGWLITAVATLAVTAVLILGASEPQRQ